MKKIKIYDLRFKNFEQGFTLFEILIAISVFAVISVAATMLVSVSLQANKSGGQKTVALELARETMEAAQAIALEKWHNIYNLNKGQANHYYPLVSAGKWTASSSDQQVSANNLQYTRYFYVENVQRNTSGNIVDSGGTDDPSTQKITVVVSWQDGAGSQLGVTTQSEYLTRSRNAAAAQTSWSTSGQTQNPTGGEDTNFNSQYAADDGNVDTTGGSVKLKTQ